MSDNIDNIDKCMSQKEKNDYLKKLNDEYYHYPQSELDYMNSPDIKICDGLKLKKIKVMDGKTVKSLIDLMKKTVKFLDDHNITYWLDSGTLLGACRNGKFIPWDDDVDLAIPYDSYIKIKEVIRTYPKVYDNNFKYRISDKYGIKFTEFVGEKKFNIDNDKPCLLKTLHLDGSIDKDVFVDLMNYFPVENKEYISNYIGWKNRFVYPFDTIYPLKKIIFEGTDYWSVNKPEIFLNKAYIFWNELAVADHAHFKYLRQDRSKKIYFTLK